MNLIISGRVEQIVKLQPAMALLRGEAGSDIEVKVLILPEKKYPFKIVGEQATNGENFRYDLKEIDGGGYALTVANLKKNAGRYHGLIRLKTDSRLKPEIAVTVSGDIRSPAP